MRDKDLRQRLMNGLGERGIEIRPGAHAIPRLSYYRKAWKTEPEDYPNALALEETSLALPLHSRMSHDDVERVSDTLKLFFD